MNVESTGLNFQNQNISKSFFVAAILTEDSDIDIVNPAIDEVRKMRWAIYIGVLLYEGLYFSRK